MYLVSFCAGIDVGREGPRNIISGGKGATMVELLADIAAIVSTLLAIYSLFKK